MVHPRSASKPGVNAAGPRPDALGRASFSTFTVSLFSMAIAFASSVVIARALGPTAKGSYDLAIATANVTAMILGSAGIAGITLAVARGDASPLPLLKVLGGLAVVQVLVAAVLLWTISATPLASALLPAERSPLVIWMISLLVAAMSVLAYSRSMLVGLQQIVSANWRDLWGRTAAVSIIVAGLVVGGLLHSTASPLLVLELTVAGTILSCFLMIQALLRIHLPREGRSGLRRVVGYGAPLYVGNLVQFLNYRLDVFLVAAFVGARELGLYATAVALGQLLWLASGSVAVALLPRVASRSPIEGAADAARLTRFTLLIGVVGAAALTLVASPLVHLVYGQAYADSIPMLLALLPGVVAFVSVSVLAAYIVGLGRPQINLMVAIVGLCATLPLDLILIPRLGAIGAAIASTVSYSLSAIVTVLWSMKLAGLPARDFLLVQRADLVFVRDALHRMVR